MSKLVSTVLAINYADPGHPPAGHPIAVTWKDDDGREETRVTIMPSEGVDVFRRHEGREWVYAARIGSAGPVPRYVFKPKH